MSKAMFIANWKMNMLQSEAEKFCQSFIELTREMGSLADVGIAPPLTAFSCVKNCLKQKPEVLLGTQNVHWLETGAHTGEISPTMLVDIGADFAIIGHSERRQFYGETDARVNQRMLAALKHGLLPIVCIGETESEFRAGKTESVVLGQLRDSLGTATSEQLAKIVLAYEPVWAIGTGLAATPEIAQNVHALIRLKVSETYGATAAKQVVILYGGSTKPDNIEELLACPDINGALVGGASLKADSFAQLIARGRKGDAQK